MMIKTLIVAVALTAAPTLSLAMGCAGGSHKQAMSCSDGTTYDSASNSCLPVSS